MVALISLRERHMAATPGRMSGKELLCVAMATSTLGVRLRCRELQEPCLERIALT